MSGKIEVKKGVGSIGDLSNISEGMIIKNYRELCKLLNIKEKAGDSKKAQLKEIERYIKFKKKKYEFIIEEIYEDPLPKIDKRKETRKDFPQFKIPIEEENNNGIYAIILNNDIYIGSTVAGFRYRFCMHNNIANKLKTYDMLQNGAEFIELVSLNNIEEPLVRKIEGDYIKYYKNKPEWNVINENNTHSFTVKNIKKKYKTIKVELNDFNKAYKILEENNIDIYKIG